eukprot:4799946-Amphidinium_carterae.1
MLDSGAGASVCSPSDFPKVAIDTKTEVTKVYRCADGRELRVYGYKWVRALVGKTQLRRTPEGGGGLNPDFS